MQHLRVTRRGRRLKDVTNLEALRKANLFPKDILHPLIAQKVASLFVRGEYDTAVFQAFKEVEVAVRDAAGYGPEDYGADMMRRAFSPKNGPLADASAPGGEQVGLMAAIPAEPSSPVITVLAELAFRKH